MISAYLRTAGERLAAPWLDKPTPASLEFLAVKGEREIKRLDDKNYFMYEILTASQKRYESRRGISGVQYTCPRLPQSVTQSERKFHLKGRLRRILRPEEYTVLEQERCHPSLSSALKTAYREPGFKEEVQGASLFGIDEDLLHTFVYVPATTADEADAKIQQYRQTVSALLQPRRICCDYKIRPMIKKNN